MSKIVNEKHQIENLKQKSCIKDITNMCTQFLTCYIKCLIDLNIDDKSDEA